MKIRTLVLLLACFFLTAVGVYFLRQISEEQLQVWLEQSGVWAPVIYCLVYAASTILLVPSTPLNLSGGLIFGVLWGTIWTSVAAIAAAIVSFIFSRTVGQRFVARQFSGRWQAWTAIDAEIGEGGLFYIFAIRLLPILPYGLVNFAAGLTSIRFRDYAIGTALGTVPGVLPFVAIGASLKALSRGDLLPLMAASALTGLSVAAATWYRRRQSSAKSKR